MTALAILRQLPSLFRYSDIRKFTTNANFFLTRALAKGLIERVVRRVYLNLLRENPPVLEEVACFLQTPSYISCEWALNRHGILLQVPTVCTVLTLNTSVGASRNLSYAGVTIEFSRIASRLFTGSETREGFNLALPEKALLDAIHLRKAVPFQDELEIDRLDLDRMMLWAESFTLPSRKLAAIIKIGADPYYTQRN